MSEPEYERIVKQDLSRAVRSERERAEKAEARVSELEAAIKNAVGWLEEGEDSRASDHRFAESVLRATMPQRSGHSVCTVTELCGVEFDPGGPACTLPKDHDMHSCEMQDSEASDLETGTPPAAPPDAAPGLRKGSGSPSPPAEARESRGAISRSVLRREAAQKGEPTPDLTGYRPSEAPVAKHVCICGKHWRDHGPGGAGCPQYEQRTNEAPPDLFAGRCKPRPLPHPLEAYYEAMSGDGPLALDWKDKPHRLVYDLIMALRLRSDNPLCAARVQSAHGTWFVCGRPAGHADHEPTAHRTDVPAVAPAHAPDCASYDFDPEKQLGPDKACDCADRGPGGIATSWPARDIVDKLAEAASILLVDKDYDGHGWELIDTAMKVAQAWLREPPGEPVQRPKEREHAEALEAVAEAARALYVETETGWGLTAKALRAQLGAFLRGVQ